MKPRFTAVMGTVRGDLHDIGKNLVATMLEGVGFGVIDLAWTSRPTSSSPPVRSTTRKSVGLSALLTTTMPAMEEIVHKLNEALNPTPIILVGGAPLTEAYAQKIAPRATAPTPPAARNWQKAFACKENKRRNTRPHARNKCSGRAPHRPWLVGCP